MSKAADAAASIVRSCHHVSPADSPLETDAVLQSLVNHEQQGIPDRAGAKGSDAFDLVLRWSLHAANYVSEFRTDC